MGAPSFELSLLAGTIRNLAELESWRAQLHASHHEVSYQIDPIDVDPVGEGLHRVRFEFGREFLDDAGIPHIARREHTWLVRDVSGRGPAILRIDEGPLVAFPGMGPQIICY